MGEAAAAGPVERLPPGAARDAVLVLRLPGGGGLITYCRPDGAHIHTLNSPEGLARKLALLASGDRPL